jgi:hypothetical protein
MFIDGRCARALENYYSSLKFLEGYEGGEEGLREALAIHRIEEKASRAVTEAMNRKGRIRLVVKA